MRWSLTRSHAPRPRALVLIGPALIGSCAHPRCLTHDAAIGDTLQSAASTNHKGTSACSSYSGSSSGPTAWGFEEFKAWWLEQHAPKVKQWPGLVEYRINFSLTPDERFDGVAEVWFQTRAEMEAVFGTARGRTRARQCHLRFGRSPYSPDRRARHRLAAAARTFVGHVGICGLASIAGQCSLRRASRVRLAR